VTLRWSYLIVSMAKMRTHHWAGATLELKKRFWRDAGRLLWLAQERALNHPSLAALRD